MLSKVANIIGHETFLMYGNCLCAIMRLRLRIVLQFGGIAIQTKAGSTVCKVTIVTMK